MEEPWNCLSPEFLVNFKSLIDNYVSPIQRGYDMAKRVIVFAPHPDDETLACGGTIAKSVKQGHEVFLVVMTDGRNSHSKRFGIQRNPSPEELSTIRQGEARRAASVLGVRENRVTFLDFVDGQLQLHIEDAEGKVKHLLTTVHPTSIYFPSSEEVHSDHRATHLIVSRAVSGLKRQPTLFLYSIRPKDSETETVGDWIIVDITRELEIKKKALAEYKSQTTNFSPLQPGPILNGDFLGRFMRTPERFLQIAPRANGGRSDSPVTPESKVLFVEQHLKRDNPF